MYLSRAFPQDHASDLRNPVEPFRNDQKGSSGRVAVLACEAHLSIS
jgi:hypothetical protein